MCEYSNIISNVCKKLGWPKLINRIKIVYSKNYAYNTSGLPVFASVMRYKTGRSSPKIICYRAFTHLNDKTKIEVIKHELCHIIDGMQVNDSVASNGGHGLTFTLLMDKIGCELFKVDSRTYSGPNYYRNHLFKTKHITKYGL